MNVLREPVTINVKMEVERFREFPDDDGVAVWGFVGDYEICLCLSRSDPRVKRIRQVMGRGGEKIEGA